MFYFELLLDNDDKIQLQTWGRNGVEIIDCPIQPYAYVPCKKEDMEMRDVKTHRPLKKRIFNEFQSYQGSRYSRDFWESDIPFERRIMLDMDWKIEDVPKCYFDIETAQLTSKIDFIENPIISIGMIFDDGREIFLDGNRPRDKSSKEFTKEELLKYEKIILQDFMKLTENIGMLIAYNGGEDVWEQRSFDIPYLATRYGLRIQNLKPDHKALRFGFDKEMRHCAFIDIFRIYKRETARVGKSLTGGYSLDNVAMKTLGKGKVKHDESIDDMEYEKLREYNMQDVRLLKELDDLFTFSEMKINMAKLTNLRLVSWYNNKKRDELKTLILCDQMVLKEARSLGLVWQNKGFTEKGSITGALVLEPKAGIFRDVQNFDVKQMYPSIMIHEKVSPDRDKVIVPNILIRLKKMRQILKEKYNKTKSTEDFITQYNFKVLANSIYGAFKNEYSRFYDLELAQYITNKGKEILQSTIQYCEKFGLEIIYGDTDSIFLSIPNDRVPILLQKINDHIAPYEMEAGEHYRAILYVGDEHGGTKKRYAGLEDDGSLKVVGLEAIKRDYCSLSRETQLLVISKLLHGESVNSVKVCVERIKDLMKSGTYDDDLILTKGVKNLADYNFKEGHRGLPHVRALRKALELGYQSSGDISYVFTTEDVEPVLERGNLPENLDYETYYKKQIWSVVHPLLKSIMIQDGTWIPDQYLKNRKLKTKSNNLLDYISS